MSTSIGTKVKQIAGLVGTKDLTRWEADFVIDILRWTERGNNTTVLSEKQIEVVLRIYNKHFAG